MIFDSTEVAGRYDDEEFVATCEVEDDEKEEEEEEDVEVEDIM